MPTPSALFASIVFGLIGAVAFGYGKRIAAWRAMLSCAALIVFPWFVNATWLLWLVGCALCACLYFFRD
jgi:hypothetical protein